MGAPPAISADAVHDGEPAALAALCAQWGVPVLAYCDKVAAPRQVARAAADAFARVRGEVVAAGEARNAIDIDALVLRATRHAAAARGMNASAPPRDVAPGCDGLETSLAAQFDHSMTPDQRAQLERHLDTCPAHARAMRLLEAGQRAFDEPPKAPLPPRIVEQIVAALVTAAPVIALEGDAAAVRNQTLQHLTSTIGTPLPAEALPATADDAAPTTPAESAPVPTIQIAPPMASEIKPDDAAPAVTPSAGGQPVTAGPAALAHDSVAATVAPAHSSGRHQTRSRTRWAATADRRAAIADWFAVARHRVLGPSPGSVERRRQPRPSLKRRRLLPPAERGARGRPGSREAELAAIGLFASVAITVALVTFLAASGS